MDYENQRKLIVVCVLAIIIVVIFSIIWIINIWIPEPEEEKVFQVGVIDVESIEEEDMVLHYYKEVSELLMKSDIDTLCDLVAEDYMKYYNYAIDDLKSYIKEKNIMNKNLELANSRIYFVPGFNHIFYLDIKAVGEVYSIGVVVRESSPNQYTIAFDKFIDYKDNIYNGAVNSVGLVVSTRARFLTSVEYRVRLTNNYDKAITINANKSSEGITLVSAQGTYKKPVMIGFSTQSVVFEPGYSREYDVTYNIEEDTDYLIYNTLVLRDVMYSGISGTNNLEFSLNK